MPFEQEEKSNQDSENTLSQVEAFQSCQMSRDSRERKSVEITTFCLLLYCERQKWWRLISIVFSCNYFVWLSKLTTRCKPPQTRLSNIASILFYVISVNLYEAIFLKGSSQVIRINHLNSQFSTHFESLKIRSEGKSSPFNAVHFLHIQC